MNIRLFPDVLIRLPLLASRASFPPCPFSAPRRPGFLIPVFIGLFDAFQSSSSGPTHTSHPVLHYLCVFACLDVSCPVPRTPRRSCLRSSHVGCRTGPDGRHLCYSWHGHRDSGPGSRGPVTRPDGFRRHDPPHCPFPALHRWAVGTGHEVGTSTILLK